ncbi:serine/threonine-protein kinase [Sinosporangium siamense]|nr:serine/threonine-protein kinase [Sinosporangium siamense]
MPTNWRIPGYTEVRELGTGAAGRVVMATRDHDGTEVAIKYLSEQLRGDVGFVARFRHEARLLASLDTPHAARFYEYRETGEGAAIIMELVEGVSLRRVLSAEGPTGPEAALVILKGSLLGLAAAHSAGLVHRDFKPENVIVEGGGTSKLVDFGIAVRAGDGNNPAGTPPYMAPEQWAGAPAGPATDVYAATIVFFECLTGERPFRGQNVAALARQHQSTPPPLDEVPAPLRGLVERGMAKHPADRPPSAEAFLAELSDAALAAYGPGWEERGRDRLGALAGLLALLFPTPAAVPDAATGLAHTTLRGGARMGGTAMKVAVGLGCAALIAGVSMTVVANTNGPTSLQAQIRTLSPSPSPESPAPATETPPLDLEVAPEEPPSAAPAEVDSDPGTSSVFSAPAPPTRRPPPSAKPAPSRAAPPPRPPRPPSPSASPTPTAEEEPNAAGDLAPNRRDDPPRPEPPAPTPPPPRPTPAPTRSTPTSDPTPTGEPTPSETQSEPSGEPETPSESTTGSSAALAGTALITTVTLPITFAIRRATGRHRNNRKRR